MWGQFGRPISIWHALSLSLVSYSSWTCNPSHQRTSDLEEVMQCSTGTHKSSLLLTCVGFLSIFGTKALKLLSIISWLASAHRERLPSLNHCGKLWAGLSKPAISTLALFALKPFLGPPPRLTPDLQHNAMAGFRYHMTFIDEPIECSLAIKRVNSSPAVMKLLLCLSTVLWVP